MKEKKVFIVDYAYGFHADRCEVDYVCKLRCQAALRALKKYPDAYIVLGAGMKEVTGDCGPLAGMMEEFLAEKHLPKEKLLRNPLGNDTLSETEAAFAIIKKNGSGKIICATSAYHAPRVAAIWLFRFGIVPEIYTTSLKPPIPERLLELFKIPWDALRGLIRRSVPRAA